MRNHQNSQFQGDQSVEDCVCVRVPFHCFEGRWREFADAVLCTAAHTHAEQQ